MHDETERQLARQHGALRARLLEREPEQPKQRIPEWLRRAREKRDQLGYVAVADLTTR